MLGRDINVADKGAVRAAHSGETGAPVPFNDISIQWREIETDMAEDLARLFATSAYSSGPFVERFEQEISSYIQVPHAIGVNSGTSALHLAMIAARICPGDDVLIPAHTFIATVWGALYVGATPVLCDVDDATACIDVLDAERRITPRTKAI